MATNLVLVGIDALPPLSPHAIELLDLDFDDADAESRLLRIVQVEPQLAAKLVAAANSAAFGLSRVRFGTVPLAIRRIGLRRSIQLCTAALVGQPLQVGLPPARRMQLWLHALATALVAAELARRLRIDSGRAYLAGLLHDIGYMFAELREPGVLDRIEALAVAQGAAIDGVEQSVLGCSHGELTGALLAYWEVPQGLSELFRDHHHLSTAASALTSVVSVAESVARLGEVTAVFAGEQGSLFADAAPDRDEMERQVESLLRSDMGDFDHLLERVRQQVSEVSGLAAVMSASTRPPEAGAHPPRGRMSHATGG